LIAAREYLTGALIRFDIKKGPVDTGPFSWLQLQSYFMSTP
jgi:hypothetical protein